MRLVNVFLGAPEGLEAERRAFHETIGEINEAEGLARGTLFVPLFASRKLHEQDVIDSNISASTYYLLALDNSWGPPGRSFEHDLQVALACREGPGLPMREAVVLLKKPAADRPMEPAVVEFRARTPLAGDPRRFEFADTPHCRAILRELLSTWLCELAPAAAGTVR